MDELWSLSLVEVAETEHGPSTGERAPTRYFLHPLTQHFVLSDIVRMVD
jgi:hypothetical protein